MLLSRDHKVPASVCSRSGKHGMAVGGGLGLRDKSRAVNPSSWPGNTGELPAGPSRLSWKNHLLGESAHPPLSSVDQERGWEGSSTQQQAP